MSQAQSPAFGEDYAPQLLEKMFAMAHERGGKLPPKAVFLQQFFQPFQSPFQLFQSSLSIFSPIFSMPAPTFFPMITNSAVSYRFNCYWFKPSL